MSGSTLRWVMTVLASVTAVTAFAVAVSVLGNPLVAQMPTAAAEPPPVTPVQTVAVAPPPPGFPDLDGFTDASQDHTVSKSYALATFTSPAGLQCAMWSSRGDTAASCYGAIPGLDHPANWVYANDQEAYFDQAAQPPAQDKLNGKPLLSGEKVVLGAGGGLMQGDQITCGVRDAEVACILINGFSQNHGDETAKRSGFVLNDQGSWTF